MQKTVLTVKELAQRWDLSEATIYSLNRSGKLPHLPFAEHRFPSKAIEAIEEDSTFNPRELKTPRERRLEREIKALNEDIKSKDEEIKRLKMCISQIQRYSTGLVYSDFKEVSL